LIIPSARLIWLTALVGFPAMVLEALAPTSGGAKEGVYTGVLAGALLVAIVLCAFADAMLRSHAIDGITIELPPLLRLVQGRDAQIPVMIHNSSRTRRLRIGFAMPDGVEVEPEQQMVDLVAATTLLKGTDSSLRSRIDWPCHPRQRGNYKIEVCYLEASSPLGLWSVRSEQAAALEIRVYPNLRDDGNPKALRRGAGQPHVIRQIGRGREFEKLREYSPGDSSDEIHWKATARRGRPITKVFQVERTQEIYLAIDTSRLSARLVDGEPALERAIKAALTVGAVTERRGDLFGIAAFSDQVEAFVRAKAGAQQYSTCRDAINQLRPRPISPDFEEIATFLQLRLRRRSLIVFLTSLDDPILAERFERATQLLARRHVVMAASIRPESAQPLFQDERVETAEDIYGALAGHVRWRKLRELQGTLARRGVRLALFEAQSFSANVVTLYDDVKQRQLL
jgi:uncharacterized protein (DUF58 family)